MKILLVEDDKKLALALGIRLKSEGYDVNSTTNAMSAISLATLHSPDVVIIDINLPGADGFTIAENLANSSVTQHTPLIFMTASKKEELRTKAEQFGAIGFLEKPFPATDLNSLIDDCR
jgi:two-component system response regulator PfeR